MFPISFLRARLFPVAYARSIGVAMKGEVTIYGSSYHMFSSEPFLVTLHDNVFISVGAKFICHDGAVLPFRREEPMLDITAPITVHENVFIGMGAVILKGVTIGRNSIVGAFAVVTRNVDEGVVVAGNPARVVCTTEAYLERARRRSLGLGHLTGDAKLAAYHLIFDAEDEQQEASR